MEDDEANEDFVFFATVTVTTKTTTTTTTTAMETMEVAITRNTLSTWKRAVASIHNSKVFVVQECTNTSPKR